MTKSLRKRLVVMLVATALAAVAGLTTRVEPAYACEMTVSTVWSGSQVWGRSTSNCGGVMTVCLQRNGGGGWGALYNCVTGGSSTMESLKGNWSCGWVYRGMASSNGGPYLPGGEVQFC